MKRLLALLAAVLLGAFIAACSDDDDAKGGPVRIGALLPTTGALESYGVNSVETLSVAMSVLNADNDRAVELLMENTNSDPATALARLRALHGEGIRVVVGPYSSSEVAAVIDFANESGILLLSPLSTAHILAIPDDALFRFTPDDIAEGVAVANLAWADGVRTIVLVIRDDVGNAGLGIAVRDAFEALGGTVVDGFVYGQDVTDFADEIASLETTAAALARPADEVGIYLAGFSEVRDLLETASASESLGSLRWYGSNSVALSSELLENEAASLFAIQIGYPNPILGLRAADEAAWRPVIERVHAEIGRDPDAFALAAYDALIVGHQALVNAGADADTEALKAALVSVANGSTGLTGPLTLNGAGDRALASYDFWGICQDASGGFHWVRVATYEGGGAAVRTAPSCYR
jgi:branched-chain amino acid transport system substrate-binding protein